MPRVNTHSSGSYPKSSQSCRITFNTEEGTEKCQLPGHYPFFFREKIQERLKEKREKSPRENSGRSLLDGVAHLRLEGAERGAFPPSSLLRPVFRALIGRPGSPLSRTPSKTETAIASLSLHPQQPVQPVVIIQLSSLTVLKQCDDDHFPIIQKGAEDSKGKPLSS